MPRRVDFISIRLIRMQCDLDSWLRSIRASGLALVRTRVGGDWGFAAPARRAAVFHFVAEGRAYLRRPGHARGELRAGELVLLPQGVEHAVAHSPKGRVVPLEEFISQCDGVRAKND